MSVSPYQPAERIIFCSFRTRRFPIGGPYDPSYGSIRTYQGPPPDPGSGGRCGTVLLGTFGRRQAALQGRRAEEYFQGDGGDSGQGWTWERCVSLTARETSGRGGVQGQADRLRCEPGKKQLLCRLRSDEEATHPGRIDRPLPPRRHGRRSLCGRGHVEHRHPTRRHQISTPVGPERDVQRVHGLREKDHQGGRGRSALERVLGGHGQGYPCERES